MRMTRDAQRKMGLVLERKVGQSLMIGRGIVVTITQTDYDRCKVAIKAPRWINVSRAEFGEQSHLEYQKRREEEHGVEHCE